jgi:Fur family transcriptional regulator, peroxide stress response regulator
MKVDPTPRGSPVRRAATRLVDAEVGPDPMMLLPLDSAGLRNALEAAGWRCTPQRAAVYAELVHAEHHPTAEEVYQRVKGVIPRISLATVYKALEALVASGLATKLSAGDGSARYDARGEQHYHFRCLRSGAVEDLATPFDPNLIAKLDPQLMQDLERKGFRVTGYRLELVGYLETADATDPGSAGA